MKLEVGKTYRGRAGHTTKIIGYEPDHPLPFIGDDKCGYQLNGRYLPYTHAEESEWDLIEEVA